MIYTCTLNPSLDYYMEVSAPIENGQINRSTLEYYEAGGKGINVSIALNNLGIPSGALGFLGGFTKDFYITLLNRYPFLRPNFTYIEGHTRINVKCDSTTINGQGPIISPQEFSNLASKVANLYEGDYFVLAGHTQEYLQQQVVEMLKQATKEKVKLILDVDDQLLEKVIDLHPFVVKTTPLELGQLYGCPIETKQQMVEYAQKLHQDGVENVFLINQHRFVIYVSELGTFYADCLLEQDELLNTVGTSDALIAGFLMHFGRSHALYESFLYGVACASSSICQKGLATKEQVENRFGKVPIEKI